MFWNTKFTSKSEQKLFFKKSGLNSGNLGEVKPAECSSIA